MKACLSMLLGVVLLGAAPLRAEEISDGIAAVVGNTERVEVIPYSELFYERGLLLAKWQEEKKATAPPSDETILKAHWEAQAALINRKLVYLDFEHRHYAIPESIIDEAMAKWAGAALPPGLTLEEKRQRCREVTAEQVMRSQFVLNAVLQEAEPNQPEAYWLKHMDRVKALKATEAYQQREAAWYASLREGAFVKTKMY